jgi:hypothetical protein
MDNQQAGLEYKGGEPDSQEAWFSLNKAFCLLGHPVDDRRRILYGRGSFHAPHGAR